LAAQTPEFRWKFLSLCFTSSGPKSVQRPPKPIVASCFVNSYTHTVPGTSFVFVLFHLGTLVYASTIFWTSFLNFRFSQLYFFPNPLVLVLHQHPVSHLVDPNFHCYQSPEHPSFHILPPLQFHR
jgi:hypothetical protein